MPYLDMPDSGRRMQIPFSGNNLSAPFMADYSQNDTCRLGIALV
jgi:hypothetical protein